MHSLQGTSKVYLIKWPVSACALWVPSKPRPLTDDDDGYADDSDKCQNS